MPQPTLGEVHTNGLLTNISIAYVQSEDMFVAGKVFPTVMVNKQSDLYRTYAKADFLRTDAQPLGPGSAAAETGYGLSTTAYNCVPYAIAAMVDDQTAANYDDPGDAEEDMVVKLTQDILRKRESDWLSTYFAASVWGAGDVTVAAGDKWDVGTSDPRKQVNDAKEAILGSTGLMPNTAVVDFRVHNSLTEHPLVRDQFKYTSADSIDEAMMARFFGLDRYFVLKAVQNSSNEGASSPSYGLMSGKHALICYSAPSPSLMAPSAGYTFAWQGFSEVGGSSRISRFEMPHRHGVLIEAANAWDHKAVATDCGYFFGSAVS